jgi:hypothetical protein
MQEHKLTIYSTKKQRRIFFFKICCFSGNVAVEKANHAALPFPHGNLAGNSRCLSAVAAPLSAAAAPLSVVEAPFSVVEASFLVIKVGTFFLKVRTFISKVGTFFSKV